MADGKDAVLRQVAEVTQYVREKADEMKASGEQREAENKETLEKFTIQINGIQEQIKKLQTPFPDGAPLSDDPEGDERFFSGSIFNGRTPANYQRMLDTSPSHPYVIGTREEGDLRKLQDLHDAASIRYHALRARGNDQAVAVQKLARHRETYLWAQALQRHGYIKDAQAFLNPQSGQLMKVALAEADETRANEMIEPTNSTQGFDNLTFTLVSAQLLDQIYVNLTVANNVSRMTLSRPSQKIPRLTGLTQGVWGGQTSANIEIPAGDKEAASVLMPADSYFQKPTISSLQFDVEHMLSFLLINDDAIEDLIIPMIPFIRSELAKNMARAWDDAILNGHSLDAAGQQDNLEGTNHARLAVDGIRYRTLGHEMATAGAQTAANASCFGGGGDALALTDIEAAIRIGGKYFLNPSQCILLLTIPQYYLMVQNAAYQTVSSVGSMATYLSGTLGAIYGYPIYVSDVIDSDVSDHGVKDTATTDVDGMSCAYIWRPDQFIWGTYGGTAMESTRWAPKLFSILQADNRGDFQSVPAATFTNNTGPWPAVCIYDVSS